MQVIAARGIGIHIITHSSVATSMMSQQQWQQCLSWVQTTTTKKLQKIAGNGDEEEEAVEPFSHVCSVGAGPEALAAARPC